MLSFAQPMRSKASASISRCRTRDPGLPVFKLGQHLIQLLIGGGQLFLPGCQYFLQAFFFCLPAEVDKFGGSGIGQQTTSSILPAAVITSCPYRYRRQPLSFGKFSPAP